MEIMPQGEKTRQVGAEAYFIRAPAVLECGPGVTELARADGIGVAVEQRPHILGTAFHPEISADPSWLRYVNKRRKCPSRPAARGYRNQRKIVME